MGTRTISTKLAVEGEAQYKQAIASCNSELSTLKSSLALVESEFRGNANSMEALTTKGSALDSMYRKQQEKVSTLEAALRNAQRAYEEYSSRISTAQSNTERCEQALEKLKKSTGDTSKEQEELTKELDKWSAELSEAQAGQAAAERGVQSWQKQLNNAKIDLNGMSDAIEQNDRCLREAEQSADGCANSIDALGDATEKAGDDTEAFSGKLKDGFSGALKSAGIAVAAVAAAAAAGIKVLNDVAEATEEYRNNQAKLNTAFESAGYSTETAKAAYQDLYAVLGDSDNATESAQLLAKLAKSEEDVAKWGDIAAGVMGTFGDALPINSLIEASNETAKVGKVTGALADSLNWVGISEDEFNEKLSACADESERTRLITETLSSAYQEASDIFQENNKVLLEANRAQAELDESMSKLGGAVAEIKTELTAEFAPAISDVVDAFAGLAEGADGADQAFAQAIDDLIGRAAEKLPELLEFGADVIINIINGIANAAPQLAEGAVTVITTLAEGLTGALPQIAEAAITVITALAEGLTGALPQVAAAAVQLISGLVSGLAQAAPELIPAAVGAVTELVQALVDNAPLLLDAALQLITALGDGLLDAIPVLLEATPEIMSSLLDAILEGIPQVIETGIILLGSLVEGLPEIIAKIVEVLPEIISSISDTLLDDIPKIIDAGVKLLTALVTDLPQIIAEIVRALPEIITGMVAELGKGISKFEDVGKDLVRGLWTGIQSLASWLWTKVSDWIGSIWDGITDFFGIASPSKEMAWIGKMLVEGLAGAISGDGGKAVEAVKDMASDMLSAVQAETGNVNKALDDAAGQAIQFSTESMENELARQKKLISSMEANLRSKNTQTNEFLSQLLFQTVSQDDFASAYGRASRSALLNMSVHLPSTLEVPDSAAAISRQTDAILSAVPSRDGGGNPIQIYVDKLEVRNDSDLPRLARELYCLTEREKRSRGGGVL